MSAVRRLLGSLRGRLSGAQGSQPHMVRLKPDAARRGRMLLSFSTQVYRRLLAGQPLDRSHVAAWQNFQIARTFLDLGFEIDVMEFSDLTTEPEGPYDVLLDVAANLGRLADRFGDGCRRILHPTFVHWAVHNACTHARHAALLERRGTALAAVRAMPPNTSAERAEFITCRGGAFSTASFSHGDATVMRIPQLTPSALEGFIERDMAACRHRFLWLGGSGLVHKGLDLTLEAFAGLPDCELFVCGRVAKERQFESLYRRELYELPNIHTLGWMDTQSEAYRELVGSCAATVFPSAAELGCGSVIAGMMTGLVPVTTDSADIDTAGFGCRIEEGTVEAVRAAVTTVRDTPPAALAEQSRAAYEASVARYGRGRFLEAFRAAMCQALGLEPLEPWSAWDAELRIPEIRQIY
jgi:hypothetical protein